RRLRERGAAADAGRARVCGDSFSVSRGAAHRRGDASAGAAGDGTVWRDAAEPGRRADPADRALEIRLQVRKEYSTYKTTGNPTDHYLEPVRRRRRIRLLRQREPRRGPPALEPGQGTAHRRDPAAQDADVQRLYGSGAALRRHGPEEVLLRSAIPGVPGVHRVHFAGRCTRCTPRTHGGDRKSTRLNSS